MAEVLDISHKLTSVGKFYKDDVSNEISASEVDQMTVAPGGMGIVNSCGRQGAAAGTEGTMDLYDGETRICGLYWDSPYWKTTNNFHLTGYDPSVSPYSVSVEAWNHGPGTLGDVNITVSLMAKTDTS
ncbi:aegerolysin type hemolysin [Trichoderma chlorosporum]